MTPARGFSLIELLAAMAILAVVAVMGVQLLGNALTQRRVLTAQDSQAAQLAQTLALLRQDLEAMLPVHGADGALPLTVTQTQARWMRGGLLDGAGAPLDRPVAVTWRVDPAQGLIRHLALDETAPQVVLLSGTTALSVEGIGGPLPRSGAADLPPGLVVTLTHPVHDTLRIVVAR